MHEHRTGNGPNWALLLLIPAAVIVAKGAMRRRAMWESAWGPSGSWGPGIAGHRFGPHAGFTPGEETAEARAAFRLPPKIEWILDTWHTRAHQQDAPTEPPTT